MLSFYSNSLQEKEDSCSLAVTDSSNPREAMALWEKKGNSVLYLLFQALITAVTGKPYQGQQPLFQLSREAVLAKTTVSLVASVTTSTFLVSHPFYWGLLPLPWLITVGSARTFLISINHRLIHSQFFGNKGDHWLAEVISTVLMLQGFDSYKHDHVHIHHHRDLCFTFQDPDAKTLLKFSFLPGLRVGDYWRRFFSLLVFPNFHWQFFSARLKANFIDVPVYRRWMSIIFNSLLLTAITICHAWIPFLIAWVFPLTILYHISTLFQLCSEHRWGAGGHPETKSHGRFCGETLPTNSSAMAWLGWITKMLFYHIPIRIAVLADPEICGHDHHHHFPKGDKDWPNTIYNRQAQIDAGAKEYIDFWGIHNAMNAVFESLAQTPALSEAEIQRLINS